MRLQWDSISTSGKDKVWFSLLPLTALVSPSARMSHFVLFHWMMIQIFIAHTVSEDIVRGTVGQPVTLPCSYPVKRPKDVTDICWGRGPCPNSKCRNNILDTTRHKVKSRASWRYNLLGSISSGDVSLTIREAKEGDAGLYCCRVEIPGPFNDIKRHIRLEVARAPPATTTTTTTTTTTRKAPVFSEHFTETFAPQATSDLQPTTEAAVLLTTSILPPETTTPESPAVATGETSALPTTAVTENYIFPVTMMETSAPPDFPTTSHAADVMTEDVTFYSTLPASPEVTTEFPGTFPASVTTEFPDTLPASVTTEFPDTLPAAEESITPDMIEKKSVMEVSANSDGIAGKHEGRGDKSPSSAIPIACAIGGSILFILIILVWKRKHTMKFTPKSVGPPEETDKVFSGAEGENNIFSL